MHYIGLHAMPGYRYQQAESRTESHVKLQACQERQGRQQQQQAHQQQKQSLPRQDAAQRMPASAAAAAAHAHPPPGQALHKGYMAAGEEQHGQGVQAQGAVAQQGDSGVLWGSI